MRNLELWDISAKTLKLDSENGLVICRGYDESCGLYEFHVCTHNLDVRNLDKNGEEKWSKSLSGIASSNNRPVNLTYLSLQNTLCVGLENGELFTITDSGETCELVGHCDSGLLAMEWSPDQELLVIVTKDLNMILMSCTFDPIAESNLSDENFGEKQFITVGWGKKETQFHGSEGKQAAKVKNEVCADPNTASDNHIKVTWRGDADLYAVGFNWDGLRRFKVFDREGQLQYTSEKQQGLEANLTWRPSGNLIATTQKLQEKLTVTFFEKNGLKHGFINLDIDATTEIEDIYWSLDSEILTLQCKDVQRDTQTLLLYTTGNYHWYLKQTLTYKCDQKIIKVLWDNDFDVANNKKLHVILQNGEYFTYTWIWNISHSRGKDSKDDAVVAVIDGKKILLTGFRQTVVPPPMAALEIMLDNNINIIQFAPHSDDIDSNSFFVYTVDNKITFYKQVNKSPLQYECVNSTILHEWDFPYEFYNYHWLTKDDLLCIKINKDIGSYCLVKHDIRSQNGSGSIHNSLPLSVIRIQSNPALFESYLLMNNGEIALYNLKDIELQFQTLSVPCYKFDTFTIENVRYFIGLSHKGHLYIDNKMVMNNISSFFLHTHFLLLTTLQHTLLAVELTESGLNALFEYQKTESEHVYKRKIERGAKLVIAVPQDTRTIFQMPRGNLETIQPRPLSLKIIGEYLDALKYYEAFDLMRKQRINLNLIHDHDPEKFMNNINVFLDSIKSNSWLNVFLADLENIDVTKDMYCSSYAGKDNKMSDVENKIQQICISFREHLNERSDKEFKILPLLTTYVKKNKVEDLEEALSIIKKLKIQESDGHRLPVGSDEALKYLLYMVDVTHLFDVALGMYDFDLVLLVANKSQKDPKEYIPMLNELNEMEENYKRFMINKHLKRFSKAVESLYRCGPSRHNELKTFVKYHSLYSEALALFSSQDTIFKEISDDFGSYLRLKKLYTEAGIIYERASIVDKAVECYKDALEWELAIKLAHNWPQNDFRKLCWDLIMLLKEEKRHKEALTILEQFYDNSDETIKYAVDSGQYKAALRICSQHNNSNLLDHCLYPALVVEYEKTKELIQNNWCEFQRYRNRLCVVRENKCKNPTEEYDHYTAKDSDLYSDAGSTVASSSRGSSRTYRSSKNRRKHERKVASLKEGSKYEDVALVMALHSLVTSSFELRLPVRELVIALYSLGKSKEASLVQDALDKVLTTMKDSFKEIWTNELVIEATNALIAAQNVPEGSSVVPQGIASLDPHVRIAPLIQDVKWKLEGLD